MVVFQETALFPWMTLLENVAYGPIQAGAKPAAAKASAADLLQKVGLAGFEQRYPSQLSGGMQRRAEVVRALINRPRLLLLDEPFRGLDHMTRGLMQEFLLRLFDEEKVTTFFVTSEVRGSSLPLRSHRRALRRTRAGESDRGSATASAPRF